MTIARNIFLVLVLLLLWGSYFVVDQTEFAVVFQFGKPVHVVTAPGLNLKWPFVQNVVHVTRRLMLYDSRPTDILTQEKKAVTADSFAAFRVVDPLAYLTMVRDIHGAQNRVDDAVYSAVRNVLSSHTFEEVIGEKRDELLGRAREIANAPLSPIGLNVQMVSVKRLIFPQTNQQSIFQRMIAERERIAKQYRSEGEEEAAKIRAEADREAATILAAANQTAKSTRGEADAGAARIYNEAYGKAPEFFALVKSLEAARESLSHAESTRIVLSGDEPVFKALLGK